MTVDLVEPGTARRAPKRRGGEAIARLIGAAATGDQRAWDALVESVAGFMISVLAQVPLLSASLAWGGPASPWVATDPRAVAAPRVGMRAQRVV
jgi:hypothetical protein